MVVYKTTPIGNLEGFMVSNILPLQQGFYGNILTCLSIRVYDNSAFLASEQGIISTVMSLTNSTAVVAELGRMPRINDIQYDILVKAPLFKILLESKERNPHDFPIKSFAFWIESLEVFNRNVCIISQSHLSNISNNFSYSVLDEVMLISFSPIQCLIRTGTSSICITLENGLPLKYFLPANPKVLPEIVLMQNLTGRRDYRNRKALAIHIDSKNILLQRQFDFVFGKIGDNLKPRSQSIGLATPSVLQQVGVSLKVAVPNNRNCNPIPRIDSKFNKRHSHSKGLAVAGNIEFDSNTFGDAFAFPNSTFQTSINLNVESGPYFGFHKGLPMEIHEGIAEISICPESVEFGSSLQGEVLEDFALLDSTLINLQKNSAFHTTNHIYKFARIYNYDARQFLPPLKRGASLSRIGEYTLIGAVFTATCREREMWIRDWRI